MSEGLIGPARPTQSQWLQLAVLGMAVLLAAALVGWLLLRDGSAESDAGAGPTIVTHDQLTAIARSSGTAVYWAGPRRGYAYELTSTEGGRVFVRYLPKGVAAGNSRASFLTVGTYPDANAFPSLERAAARADTNSARLPHDGIAVIYKRSPTSVYVGRRGLPAQAEVYDPVPDHARDLVLTGAVVPVR